MTSSTRRRTSGSSSGSEGLGELSDYPASPMLAMLELGAGSEYLFCDLDPESCANICEVARSARA